MGTNISLHSRSRATDKNDCFHTSRMFDLFEGFVDNGWESIDTAEYSD